MKYYSNGKLLLTGEYLVLEGATALALPTKFGQSLRVTPAPQRELEWVSFDHKNRHWLQVLFDWKGDRLELQRDYVFGRLPKREEPTAARLEHLLNYAHQKNPKVLSNGHGFEVLAYLEFPRNWGLGSSSTFINNLASWFEIDPYDLLEQSFGGSGYDIACAQYNYPILYKREGDKRTVVPAAFNPEFKDEIFLIHQNKKQDSRQAIAHFRKQSPQRIASAIEEVDQITREMIACDDLKEFELLVHAHETVMSGILNLPTIKSERFPDYPGAIKSLGAWGGDFMLVTGFPELMQYFVDKGYRTILPYEDLIL